MSNNSNNNSLSSSGIDSDFIVNRCALKDDIINKKINSSAFDDIFSRSLLENEKKKDAVSQENNNKKKAEARANNKKSGGPAAYDNYGELDMRDLLSKVMVNQQDHSSNELESYEGELYLPNLIREVGEEAPIQPLLFQNTKQGTERNAVKTLIIDSGTTGAKLDAGSTFPLKDEGTPKAVTNLGKNTWHKFRVNLQETFKIDRLSDIYLKGFTLIGATKNINCLYFAIFIEEFNILKPSNNKFLKDKIVVRNTNTTDSADQVVSVEYPRMTNYIASTNPQTFYNLTIELTNENGEHAEDNDNKTFKTKNASTNRIIMELEFVPRAKPNDIIFDRTPYGSALNAELSNT